MTHSLPRPACGDDDTEVLVLPNGIEANLKLNAARKAYKARFNQESVLLVTQPACVDF